MNKLFDNAKNILISKSSWNLEKSNDIDITLKINASTLAEDTLSFLKYLIINENISSILEFGSGISTLLISKVLHEYLNLENYDYYCIDDSKDYLLKTKNAVFERYPNNIVHFIHAPIAKIKINKMKYLGYSNKVIQNSIKDVKFRLILIDGPLSHKYRRETSLYLALPYIDVDSLILLDDSNRDFERDDIRKWGKMFKSGINIVSYDNFKKGLTLVSFNKNYHNSISYNFLNKNIYKINSL